MSRQADAIERIVKYPAKHLRVLGLPGSGKTRLLIDRYKNLTTSEDATPVFILTYSREQLHRISEAVLDDGSTHEGLPPVLTHFTLAREIIAASGAEPPRIVEGFEEALLVERIVRRSEKTLKSDYRKITSSERFQRELLDLFHLLQQNAIRGESLQRLTAARQPADCRDVLYLYAEFVAALEAERAATFYDVSWIASRACQRLPADHALLRVGVILVDDFQDIDAGQFAVLCNLAPPEGHTALTVFGDPMGAYFGTRGTDARFMTTELPRIYGGETIVLPRRCHATSVIGSTLDALTTEVLGSGAAAFADSSEPPSAGTWGPLFDRSDANTGSVGLRVVDDEVAEVYEAAARAHALIASGRFRPCDIAVVTNDKARYEPLLRAAFAQRGVPMETGRPLHGAFRSFVHALLQLVRSAHDDVALQALVTSPFFPYFRAQCLDTDERADVERYRLYDATREYIRNEGAAMRAKEGVQWLHHIVARSIRPACTAYLEESGDDGIYTFLSRLKESWAEYAGAADAVGAPVDIASFIRKSGLFASRSAAPSPSALEVGFYSCREVKSRTFPAVLVLGCSEMLFPSILRRETIMPAGDLQALLERALPDHHVKVHAARSAAGHLADEYHLLYHSFTRATDVLDVYAPRKFAGQAYPAPSAVIDATLPASARVESEAGARVPPSVRFARAWVRRGGAVDADVQLRELSPLGRLWNEERDARADFAIDAFPLSKTSLDNYVKCPRRFFYTKVLRVKEEESGALKVGKIFHEVLADLARSNKTKRQFHATATDEKIREAIEREIQKDRSAPPDSLFGASLRFFLYYMTRSALRHDRDTSDDYEIDGVESPLDFTHGGFAFTGRADIVKKPTSGAVVVDYKSGEFKKTGKNLRERTLDALTHPEKANWQVPIYAWGYGAQAKRVLPAAFTHIVQGPGQDPFHVTLHICPREQDAPAQARSRKQDDNAHSYLLESEISEIIDRAATFAGEIFGERAGFERTEDLAQCRQCAFNQLCGRRTD